MLQDAVLDFDTLAWAAICFYYTSVGDKKYGKIMSDTSFISQLREAPINISYEDFEQKLILDYVNIESYDLLIRYNFSRNVLGKIIELQPLISSLQNLSILQCDLSDSDVAERINRVYMGLSGIYGLWTTGATKILHVLNDRLFPILDQEISSHYMLVDSDAKLLEWMKLVQQHAQEVTKDFLEKGYSTSPESFLSQKLWYTDHGYEKSLVKFIDEYFFLLIVYNLPVPPTWFPS